MTTTASRLTTIASMREPIKITTYLNDNVLRFTRIFTPDNGYIDLHTLAMIDTVIACLQEHRQAIIKELEEFSN